MSDPDCAIKCIDFSTDHFSIEDKPAVVDGHEGYATQVTPRITHFGDDVEYIVEVDIEATLYESGKICSFKTCSRFQLQFSKAFRILEHAGSDYVIGIFSQLFYTPVANVMARLQEIPAEQFSKIPCRPQDFSTR